MLTLFFVLGGLGLNCAFGKDVAQSETFSIANNALRVAVDAQNGHVVQLVDLAANCNLVGDTTQSYGLWKLVGAVDDQPLTLEPHDAREFRVERIDEQQPGMRLIWSDFAPDVAAQCTVVVTVHLGNGTPMSRWAIRVDKPTGLGLDEVYFPRVAGLRRQSDEHLAVPIWMGQQLPQPRKLLCSSNGRRLAWSYPGTLSMQLLAYYQLGGSGFYVRRI